VSPDNFHDSERAGGGGRRNKTTKNERKRGMRGKMGVE